MSQKDAEAHQRHLIGACVQAAKARGYSDASGVLRGTLLLSPCPLSLDDLVEKTGYSKSTVSSNMSLLENLGLAVRIITPGDKRYHYASVIDPNSMKSSMMTNIKREVDLILGALDQTERDLKIGQTDKERILDRIATIRQLYRQTDLVINLVGRYTTEELIEKLKI